MARILIAEDDESLRFFLERALQRVGHEVIAVGSGNEAVPVMAESRFDLLLADVVMPEMDGIELAERAAEIDPKLPIMFITGFAAVAVRRSGGFAAPTRVLSKPFHLRDLVREVERMLKPLGRPRPTGPT